MLYKNTKAMVHSTDENTDVFDTISPYMFIISLDYMNLNRSNKRK